MSLFGPSSPGESRFRTHARRILLLGAPLTVNNVAIAGMGFTDTVMAGHLGAAALAAVAIGHAFWMLFYMCGLGILMAVSPTVAHLYGAGENETIGDIARQALWLAALLALVLVFGMLFVHPILLAIGIEPHIARVAADFVHAICFGVPALLTFLALRFTSEGIGWTRPIMYTALIGLVVNVFGCWVFMYGKLGFPAMGAVGSGVSNALVMWVMLVVMFFYVRRRRVYRPFKLFARFDWPDAGRLREILGLGVPIAGSVLSEGGLFVVAALMVGTLGATAVAAHQIAINYASLMFMVPLSIHSATTIHVGHALGRGSPQEGRFGGFTGIALCGLFMTASAIAILFFGEEIAALYTKDADVRTLAASLLLMAGIFQISDGLQVGAAGALRGFKDVRVPMLLNLLSYWGIGFPLAYGLGVAGGLGTVYVWVGLIAGLTVCAILLNVRYTLVSRRAVLSAAGARGTP